MSRFFIITTNCTVLVFLLIGFPAATRADIGSLQISSAPAIKMLTFCGLGLAIAGNIVAALYLVKSRKERILCWEWTTIFCALLLAQIAFANGYIGFGWLKNSLLWLQKHF